MSLGVLGLNMLHQKMCCSSMHYALLYATQVGQRGVCWATLWGRGKFISLLNRIESSVKAFWTANGAGRWKKLKFGWTEMDLNDFQSPRFSKNKE